MIIVSNCIQFFNIFFDYFWDYILLPTTIPIYPVSFEERKRGIILADHIYFLIYDHCYFLRRQMFKALVVKHFSEQTAI